MVASNVQSIHCIHSSIYIRYIDSIICIRSIHCIHSSIYIHLVDFSICIHNIDSSCCIHSIHPIHSSICIHSMNSADDQQWMHLGKSEQKLPKVATSGQKSAKVDKRGWSVCR
eukprot:EG_transcript_43338